MFKQPLSAFIALVALLYSGCSVSPRGNLQTAHAYDPGPKTFQLAPPKAGRDKPVVAILAHNKGAETTDFMVPYGVLSQAEVATVVALAPDPGRVALFPALTVEVDMGFERFASRYPEGADVVIVPAFHHTRDARVLAWLNAQAESGATIVGICDGVWVLAEAGLLEGRFATGHWFSLNRLARKFPDTQWVTDRRYLADHGVVTTTGVSASIPVSLALVEAMSDAEVAQLLAERLGLSDYSDAHDSHRYGLSARILSTAVLNRVRVWQQDTHEVPLYEGIDEIALALTADAWSRTYRSRVVTTTDTNKLDAVPSLGGLMLMPDRSMTVPTEPMGVTPGLTEIVDAIGVRYGSITAEFVAQQLEL